MTQVNIIATLCLIASPAVCEDYQLNVEANYWTANECQIQAMLQMPELLKQHPDKVVKKFSCLGKGKPKIQALLLKRDLRSFSAQPASLRLTS